MAFPFQSVIEAYHTTFDFGAWSHLAKFLSREADVFVEVAHPFEQQRSKSSSCHVYRAGVEVKRLVFPRVVAPSSVLYLKDCLATLWFARRIDRKFDLFIGLDSLNAMAGIILRRLGICKRVVFCSIDYTPRRFGNIILNTVYHLLERFVIGKVDYVWSSSDAIYEVNDRRGARINYVVTPGVAWPILAKPLNAIDREKLVYLGNLAPEKGIQVLLRSMEAIVRKCPTASLLIIGSGPYEGELKSLVGRLSLTHRVQFAGRIANQLEVRDLLSKCGIGVAPYAPTAYEPYGFPGKVVEYMSCGLPVVMTGVPLFSRVVELRGAGLIVSYDEKEIAAAAQELLTNDDIYLQCRKNAIGLASEYRSDEILSRVFSKMNQQRVAPRRNDRVPHKARSYESRTLP